jgi:phosphoribosylformylglycinamidine synthase
MTTFETHATSPDSSATPPRLLRVEVHPLDPSDDPLGRSVAAEAAELHLAPGLTSVATARIYLIQADLDDASAHRIAAELLADPINQRFTLGSSPIAPGSSLIEVHYLPGVMDPVAQSTQDAIAEMLPALGPVQVRTGFRYDLHNASPDEAADIARRLLCNAVVQSYHTQPLHPEKFIELAPYRFHLTHIAIRDLDEPALMKMSREAHLFLSLDEMQAIQNHYRTIGRDPTDIELETLAQTWSEHCVHKTLKATISYKPANNDAAALTPTTADFTNRPGHRLEADGTLVISNLLKSTIAAATRKLIDDGTVDWCVSVFVDNAGVIRFDDTDAVTFKVETHNRPSAIEPYGGAATGIGGCIRDTMGTGLGAKPIANTDIFAVADPNFPVDHLPRGVIHPRRVLKQVVAGVRDYGNRMGIPTVNGAVYFDDRYLGNPLVFAGSVGIIPLDKCTKKTMPGDRIIALGGSTGRDGIHGATFSSAELTDTHADEFAHAVQIGNAITEKKVLDVILQARDHPTGPLYHAITDCGAGGFSSAVGEMGSELGAFVELSAAPLKYAGLSYTEIWISEAQERMVLAVPPDRLQALADLCRREDVQMCDLGHFGTDDAQLILHYQGQEVGRMPMHFLHDGIPMPTRSAVWAGPSEQRASLTTQQTSTEGVDIQSLLPRLLAHPNIASKHWIIRQYDHEVQAGSVVKPLTGVQADGPSDAAVIRPKLSTHRGIALSCGLQTSLGDFDAYWMTLASIDEAVRNAVCAGADPSRIAILDNFCWAKCDVPQNLGSLVRAAQACYDGALAYRTPFISGKDSLSNQFVTDTGRIIAIPPTLLISAISLVDDVRRATTMDAKAPGNLLLQVGLTTPHLAASHLAALLTPASQSPGTPASSSQSPGTPVPGALGSDFVDWSTFPRVDLATAPQHLAAVASLIASGLVRSAHDCSEGGMLVAAAEMAFAGRLGLELHTAGVPRDTSSATPLSPIAACFAEDPTRILLEIEPASFQSVVAALRKANVPFGHIGTFNDTGHVTLFNDHRKPLAAWSIDDLLTTWRKPLDW